MHTLVRNTRLSERTVRTALDRLAAAGVIRPCAPQIIAATISRADRRPQGWDLALEQIRTDLTDADIAVLERQFPGLRQRVSSARAATTQAQDSTAADDSGNGVRGLHPAPARPVDNPDTGGTGGVQLLHPAGRTGCSQRSNGVQLTHERGAAAAPEPSVEPSREHLRWPRTRGPAPSPVLAGESRKPVPPDPPGADKLLAWYVAGCERRPPARLLGQLGRQVAGMLAEGIDPAAISRGLDRFRARPAHPSALPSMVNEELNSAGPVTARRYAALELAAAMYAEEEPGRDQSPDRRVAQADHEP